MLGVNAFHDSTLEYDHRRWGVGGEAFGEFLTLRGNYYGAYTGWRLVQETALNRIEERALSGFDTEHEMPLPYMPWARLAGGYYQWDPKETRDIHGFSGRLQMDLTPNLRFESSLLTDNQSTSWLFKLSMALGAPREIQFSASETGLSRTAFVPRQVEDQSIARVRRNNTVAVERKTTNKVTGSVSGGVVFARGS